MGMYFYGITQEQFLEIMNSDARAELEFREVNEPHGDLVDIDELRRKINEVKYDSVKMFTCTDFKEGMISALEYILTYFINEAPTIIKAEGVTNEEMEL